MKVTANNKGRKCSAPHRHRAGRPSRHRCDTLNLSGTGLFISYRGPPLTNISFSIKRVHHDVKKQPEQYF